MPPGALRKALALSRETQFGWGVTDRPVRPRFPLAAFGTPVADFSCCLKMPAWPTGR
jgi:hypothetical protein